MQIANTVKKYLWLYSNCIENLAGYSVVTMLEHNQVYKKASDTEACKLLRHSGMNWEFNGHNSQTQNQSVIRLRRVSSVVWVIEAWLV